MKRHILLLTLLSFAFVAHSRVIIFDLGDTLVRPFSTRMMRAVGVWRFFSFLSLDWRNPFTMKSHIEELLHTTLDLYKSPFEKSATLPAPLRADGKPIAALMIDWHAGRISSEDARKIGKALVLVADIKGMFISIRERDLIAATIDAIFTPEILAQTFNPIPEAVALLKEISQLRDNKTGNPHRCMLLSNIDSETIEVFKAAHGAEIFSYFGPADIVTSSMLGEVKPRDAIYQKFIDQYDLKPEECIFFDDRPENIAAAKRYGIDGLVINPTRYKRALRKIRACSRAA